METSENKLDNKKQSRMHQFKDGFLSRIKEVFNKEPKIMKAFWYKWRLDKCEDWDRVEYHEEDVELWEEYLKVTIKPWDKKDLLRWTERAEIQQFDKINYDEKYIQKLSFKIPEDFVLCPRRTVIWQRKRSPEITRNDAPLLSLRIKKIEGKYYLVLTDWNGENIWKAISMEGIIWKDVNSECKVQFSDKWESVTCVKVWEEIIYDWPITIFHPSKIKDGTQAYFKCGLYRDRYKYAINKIKKDKELKPEEKRVQIGEIKDAEIKERTQDSYIIFKNYSIKKLQEKDLLH